MRVLVLAGGGGTRLWPLSTEEHPKQFITLPGLTSSLFQITLQRAILFCESTEIIVVTSKRYKDLVLTQSQEIGVTLNHEQLFLESKRLNTLPAILAGLLFAKVELSEDVLVLPSDHILGDEHALVDAVSRAKHSIQTNISVFGITPSSPHTGYGYIKPNNSISKGLLLVDEFKEKPDAETASIYMSNGYLWNAGIFYFNAGFFIESLKIHQPQMLHHFTSNTDINGAFDSWEQSISIDYGLMELISSIVVSEVNTSWTDIGSFDALIEYINQTNQSIQQIGGTGSVLITEDTVKTVFIGVDDLIVVQTKHGRLICKKGKSQLVREITE
jgi:mannose-1-phosphate guanylyltransferase / mannose-6-phosphate isomerase